MSLPADSLRQDALNSLEALWRQTRRSLKRPLVPPLPRNLVDNYIRLRTKRFRQHIGLAVNATVMTLLIHEAFSLLLPSILAPIPLTAMYLTLLVELTLWLISRRVNSLGMIQVVAVATFLAPLFLLFQYQALNISYYLIIMFVMGFLMPWNALEVIWVVSIPFLTFLAAHVNARNMEGTADEIFILLVSSGIIFSLQLMQEQERRVTFVVESEAEETRRELLDSLALAARLHAELLSESQDYPALAARVLYEPMQLLGGDYVRTQALSPQRTAMLVADVTGHGAPAALMINRIDAKIESILAKSSRPGAAAEELNEFVSRTFDGTGMLMSALWTEYDSTDRTLRWSNFGHPPALLLEQRSKRIRLLPGNDFLMGIDRARPSTEAATLVEPGDIIVFYTDGLIEMETRTGWFDLGELQNYLREGLEATTKPWTADDVIARLARAVRSRRLGEAQDDLLFIAWEIRA